MLVKTITALMIFLITAVPCYAREFSLADVMSAPFPGALTAAPANGAVAWVQNAKGVRNIWVASAPDYTSQQITNYQKDDGRELGGLTWTPDGRTIVYVRGGAANGKGEHPNPDSDPRGADQDLWKIDANGGTPLLLGTGSSPAVSPDGKGVAYLLDGQIYYVGLNSANPEPMPLIKSRGRSMGLRWSPDGSQLAFVSHRGEYSFVAVWNKEQNQVTFMNPGVDRDMSPVWSPDGNKLAFLRNRNAESGFQAVRVDTPWSIMVADVKSGTATTVFTADEGYGSSVPYNSAKQQLYWGAGDHIVFSSEKTGWNLLYSLSAAGGKPVLLTPGEFEIEREQITLGPKGKYVYFNSNQGDLERRDLWRVAVDGGKPESLTTGNRIEWAATPLVDGSLAFVQSSATSPARAMLLRNGKQQALAPQTMPDQFPAKDLVEPEVIHYIGTDGMRIPGQLFLPKNYSKRKQYPALVFMHGGSMRQMLPAFHYMGYYHNAYAMNQYLASQGYIVLSANYRRGTGYGLEFREALDSGPDGATEYYDIAGAGLYLRNRPDVDPDRIGLWGGSYGGYLTAMGLARGSDLFAAGVDLHGVHDWNDSMQEIDPDYSRLKYPEAAKRAYYASPVASLNVWRSPVLLISGDDDRNVAIEQSVKLARELRRRNVNVETLIFPDEVHGFLMHKTWLKTYRATLEFFNRKMSD